MTPKTCLRCDWQGPTKATTCPNCAAPLYVVGTPPSEGAGVQAGGHPEERSREAASTGIVAPTAAPTAETPPQPEPPHAADAGAVDVAMLRRGWPSLMDHLQSTRQMILKASLESATVADFDGDRLELAFPPDKRFTVEKVEAKADVLRAALGDMFGIRPAIMCVVREARDPAGGPTLIDIVDDEDAPSEEEALRRVQEMFGAQVTADASEPAE